MRFSLLLLVSSFALGVGAAIPDLEPAFRRSPGALLAEARVARRDPASYALIMRDDLTIVVDADRRAVSRRRLLIRLDGSQAIERWGTVSVTYSPWYQSRPELKARVIGPDGRESWLDLNTVAEYPVYPESSRLLSDRRVLRAPLPGVVIGSVVEIDTLIRDHRRGFPTGSVFGVGFSDQVPVDSSRMLVDAPSGMPLHHTIRGGESALVRKEEVGGRIRLAIDGQATLARPAPEPFTAPDIVQQGYALVAIGKDWNEMARAYDSIVEAALVGADVAAQVAAATQGARDRDARIAALVRWLHANVRYTGLEFGDAAIVPRTPAEVIGRGFGDCKDKSVLLVALLRASGIDARVALLRAAVDQDVDPELPALAAFNHAIVYIPGTKPVWIDATDDFARPGALDATVQGRLALVVAPATKGLVTIPADQSATNLVHETREVRFPITGKPTVLETTEYNGAAERAIRRQVATHAYEDMRGAAEAYVKSQYESATLARYELSVPADLTTPFRYVIQADGVGTGIAELFQVSLALSKGGVFERLPEGLRRASRSQDGRNRYDDAGFRQHDLYLLEPYTYIIDYSIVLPPGFALAEPLADQSTPMGAAVLSRATTTQKDGALRVRYRFDTGPRRWTPIQVNEFRAALDAWSATDRDVLKFAHRARPMFAAGDHAGALALLDAERSAAPTTSTTLRLVYGYVEAGLSDAARDLLQGLTPAPADEIAVEAARAWVAMHNPLGVYGGVGNDRALAEQAYRRLLSLAPDNLDYAVALAEVLERGTDGMVYGKGARLDEAAALLRRAASGPRQRIVEEKLMANRIFADAPAEAVTIGRRAPQGDKRDAFLLCAVAMTQGTDAALREPARLGLTDAQRQKALETAARSLYLFRRYDLAAALLTVAARERTDSATLLSLADQWRGMARVETLQLGPRERFLLEVVRAAVHGANGRALDSSFASYLRLAAVRAEADRVYRDFRSIRELRARATGLEDVTIDDMFTLEHWEFDQRGEGVRARLVDKKDKQSLVFYMVQERGAWRLVASQSPALLGQQALRDLKRNDRDGAAHWVRWALAHIADAARGDPYTRNGAKLAFEALPYEQAVGLAALMLAAGGLGGTDPIAELERQLPDATASHREALELALVDAWIANDLHDRATTILQRWTGVAPESYGAYRRLNTVLDKLGRLDELQAAASRRLATVPGDRPALRTLADVAEHRGDFATARKHFLTIDAGGDATASDVNTLAWLDVIEGRTDQRTLELARRAVTMSGHAEGYILNTLAVVLAELGKYVDAREALRQTLVADRRDTLEDADRLVFGRIAAGLGAKALAKRYYEQIERPANPLDVYTSSWTPAQRFLKGLAAASPKR